MHSTVAPSGGRMHYSGNTSSHKNRRSVLERLSLVTALSQKLIIARIAESNRDGIFSKSL